MLDGVDDQVAQRPARPAGRPPRRSPGASVPAAASVPLCARRAAPTASTHAVHDAVQVDRARPSSAAAPASNRLISSRSASSASNLLSSGYCSPPHGKLNGPAKACATPGDACAHKTRQPPRDVAEVDGSGRRETLGQIRTRPAGSRSFQGRCRFQRTMVRPTHRVAPPNVRAFQVPDGTRRQVPCGTSASSIVILPYRNTSNFSVEIQGEKV